MVNCGGMTILRDVGKQTPGSDADHLCTHRPAHLLSLEHVYHRDALHYEHRHSCCHTTPQRRTLSRPVTAPPDLLTRVIHAHIIGVAKLHRHQHSLLPVNHREHQPSRLSPPRSNRAKKITRDQGNQLPARKQSAINAPGPKSLVEICV
ncbi:hypothetical protein BS47DRAFT_1394709 [Hydnum rufescens UP504]|uniref:Uncharacterized protein n=1 Tax=Hydnum rufescens UP504 TaxID=1448309 RepID=A0A9P6AUE3_9AGAM|nr:hypothetical protein BS47DRAFT_1394709 [Hydnum rufescens UP504]